MNAATSNFPSVVFKVLSQAHLSPPQKLQPIKRENKVNISYLLPWEEYWTCPDTRDCYRSEVPPQPPGPFRKPPSEGLNMAADLRKTTKWDRGQIPVTSQKKGEEDTSSLNRRKNQDLRRACQDQHTVLTEMFLFLSNEGVSSNLVPEAEFLSSQLSRDRSDGRPSSRPAAVQHWDLLHGSAVLGPAGRRTIILVYCCKRMITGCKYIYTITATNYWLYKLTADPFLTFPTFGPSCKPLIGLFFELATQHKTTQRNATHKIFINSGAKQSSCVCAKEIWLKWQKRLDRIRTRKLHQPL